MPWMHTPPSHSDSRCTSALCCRYLVLMSDGIFEFMDCEEVVDMVHGLARAGLAPHQVAARLVREARRR